MFTNVPVILVSFIKLFINFMIFTVLKVPNNLVKS